MTNAVSPNDPGYLCARRHFLGEPEAALYTQLIHDADRCLMSAANFLELSIVIEGQIGPDAGRHLGQWCSLKLQSWPWSRPAPLRLF
jgi:hypothetical protein